MTAPPPSGPVVEDPELDVRRVAPPAPPRLLSSRAIAGLVAGVAIFAVAVAARLLPPVPLPPALVLALFVATALALYRPSPEPSLGLGGVLMPAVTGVAGPAATAILAAVAVMLAELVADRALYPLPDRRGTARRLEKAAGVALATLAGSLAWRAALPVVPGPPGDLFLAAVACGLAAAVVLALVRAGAAWLRERDLPPPRAFAAPALDGVAWAAGAPLAAVAAVLGPGVAGFLAVLVATVATEAARHHFARERLAHRSQRLRGVAAAPDRLGVAPAGAAANGPAAALAAALHRECAGALPIQWFQLDLLAGTLGGTTWGCGPAGLIAPGAVHPPAAPPALPGFHRRPHWRVVDRELAAEGTVLGRLRLWCDPRHLDPHLLDLFDALLPQLGAVLQRTLLDQQAKSDPLTGVAVRRVLERQLTAAFGRARDEGTALAVTMLDIDHFKRINDTYGHTAGDRALIAVARTLVEGCGERDLVCRYGGEEFTLLAEGVDGADALQRAEALRARIAALVFEVDGHAVPLTASAGVAAFPELCVRRGEDLLQLADEALYEAKRQGRNRVLLARGAGATVSPSGEVHGERTGEPPATPTIFA